VHLLIYRYYLDNGYKVSLTMKTIIVAIACASIFSTSVNAHDRQQDIQCEKTKQKIKNLQSRMRQGYTRAQGEKMRSQLRELRAIRSKQCR